MEKEFISYEQSLALKELGFDEPCMAQWNDSNGFDGFGGNYRNSYFTYPDQIAVPLYQQAFRWFREKYELTFYIEKPYHHKSDWRYVIDVNENEWLEESYKSYEEAELECLKKLIEIVKQKK